MPDPKTCREHAAKCEQVAATFPPSKQRDIFLDMARDWIKHAEKVESWEASLNQPNTDDERYWSRYRIDAPSLRSRRT